MKIAVSGKGGTGKTTLAASLALTLAGRGGEVIALDADPDSNLAAALGIPPEERERIIPISRLHDLIEERTGAKPGTSGQVFRLNPEVSDILEKYGTPHKNIRLIAIGAIREGGGGCACPENTLIRSLVSDLILRKDQHLVMDMEAGVEHLGRATARGVEAFTIVVEPGRNAVDCARRIVELAGTIGVRRTEILANKVASDRDREFLREAFPGRTLHFFPYSDRVREADREGKPALENFSEEALKALDNLIATLEGGG